MISSSESVRPDIDYEAGGSLMKKIIVFILALSLVLCTSAGLAEGQKGPGGRGGNGGARGGAGGSPVLTH